MAIYFIIGIMLITWTTTRQVTKNRDYMFNYAFKQASWWFASIVCVIFWPLLVAWALYDAIRESKEIRGL